MRFGMGGRRASRKHAAHISTAPSAPSRGAPVSGIAVSPQRALNDTASRKARGSGQVDSAMEIPVTCTCVYDTLLSELRSGIN